MTSADEKIQLQFRRNRMEGILADLPNHKACEHCRSISKLTAKICPICHAYCWVYDAATVKETAQIIGSTPYPLTAGTIPRF